MAAPAVHPYDEACAWLEAVLRVECPGRRIKDCAECGARFLAPPQNYAARECQRCYFRSQREADEAWDREAYRRYLAEGIAEPEPEPEPELVAEGRLF